MAQYPMTATGTTSETYFPVEAEEGSQGQRLAVTMKSRTVRLLNLNTFFPVEYRVDSGPWSVIAAGTERLLRPLDLSMHTVDLRRALHAPVVQIRATVKCPPTGAVAQLEVGPDVLVVQDGGTQGPTLSMADQLASAVAEYLNGRATTGGTVDGPAVYQGTGAPSDDLGEPGDSYIDPITGDIYLKS